MVCAGERQRGLKSSSPVSMAVGPERTKPLHNFDLPCLKWGSQRYLRCLRVVPNGGGIDRRSDVPRFESSLINRRRESEPERRKIRIPRPVMENNYNNDDNDNDDGIAAMREKILLELKTKAIAMSDRILREEVADGDGGGADAEAGEQSAAAVLESRPWNLRTRRAACKAPVSGGGAKSSGIEERRRSNYSPPRSESANGVKSPRLVRALVSEKKKERARFSVALSKKDIEDDFMELLGRRPGRRPKKRPKHIQNLLDPLFPGLYLNEITTATYRVPEAPETGKR
ncbi:hypothetical protein PanWU01x14_019040 [Parasponia andersonii]|uniref:DUF1639 family protein n=1 Tax=Parasponia andersonii TaxID=3476 RepID=A0A2P5DZH8_PARAD|nr:hypothetical protein PanWU01x14_019040 [Parasponia andersonii]